MERIRNFEFACIAIVLFALVVWFSYLTYMIIMPSPCVDHYVKLGFITFFWCCYVFIFIAIMNITALSDRYSKSKW